MEPLGGNVWERRHRDDVETWNELTGSRTTAHAAMGVLSPSLVGVLQRTAGNAAVAGLMHRTRADGTQLSIQRTTKGEVMARIELQYLDDRVNQDKKMAEFKRWVELGGPSFDDVKEVDRFVKPFSARDVLQLIGMVGLNITDLGAVKAYTAKGGAKINVDPLMDPRLAKHIGAVKEKQTRKSGGKRAAQSVYTIHVQYENSKEKRKEMTKGKTNTPLGDLLEAEALMCREKALFAHVVLADLAIPTTVRSGRNPDPGGRRHAWLVVADRWEIDPIQGSVRENLDRTRKHTTEVQDKVVVRPLRQLSPTKLETRMTNLVAHFATLRG